MAVAVGDGKVNEMYLTQHWKRPTKFRVYLSFFPNNLTQVLSTVSKYLVLPQEDLTSQSLLWGRLRDPGASLCPGSLSLSPLGCHMRSVGQSSIA